MALKIKKRSALTGKVELAGPLDGVVVEVRHVSPQHNRDLWREARRNTADEELAGERYSRAYCDAAIIQVIGLRPDMLDAVLEFEEDSDKPQPNGDGSIHADKDLIHALWTAAQPEHFQNQIFGANRRLLEQSAIEKKRISADSSN